MKQKNVTFYHGAAALGLMVLIMFSSIALFGAALQIPLIFGCAAVGLIAVQAGFSWEELMGSMTKGVSRSMEALLILMLIGVLVGTWIACGTVPTMIYYGLTFCSAKIFVPVTLLLCLLVACVIGSWGTIGTMGIAFMGIGTALQIPAPVTAGCIVSGAYLGEIISPLTDASNLMSAITGEPVFRISKKLVRPAMAALAIALILYVLVGVKYANPGGMAMEGEIDSLLGGLRSSFAISPLALIPLAVVGTCMALKAPAIPAVLAGILSSMVLAIFQQHVSLDALLDICYHGFHSDSGMETLDQLLSAGGMAEMLNTISIIILAMCFGGIMEHTGLINAAISPLAARLKRFSSLNAVTIFSSIGLNVILPNQYLAISLPAQMYGKAWEAHDMERSDLGAALLGSGAVTSLLIPWNTCGIYITKMLGVSPAEFAPYAFFCLLLPVFMIWSGRKKTKMAVLKRQASGERG